MYFDGGDFFLPPGFVRQSGGRTFPPPGSAGGSISKQCSPELPVPDADSAGGEADGGAQCWGEVSVCQIVAAGFQGEGGESCPDSAEHTWGTARGSRWVGSPLTLSCSHSRLCLSLGLSVCLSLSFSITVCLSLSLSHSLSVCLSLPLSPPLSLPPSLSLFLSLSESLCFRFHHLSMYFCFLLLLICMRGRGRECGWV